MSFVLISWFCREKANGDFRRSTPFFHSCVSDVIFRHMVFSSLRITRRWGLRQKVCGMLDRKQQLPTLAESRLGLKDADL